MNKKPIIVISIVTVAVFVLGLFYLLKLESKNSSVVTAYPVDKISDSDFVKGNKEAKVILIEYSDFQCPACKYYQPIVKKLGEDFSDKLVISYRHFPLSQHLNSRVSAYAAEAAGKQSEFWGMHDKIFETQDEWALSSEPKELFTEYAKSLGLDEEKFKSDMDLFEIKDKVEEQLKSGEKYYVTSTPSFFLNGRKIKVPPDYEGFKKLIEDKL